MTRNDNGLGERGKRT